MLNEDLWEDSDGPEEDGERQEEIYEGGRAR